MRWTAAILLVIASATPALAQGSVSSGDPANAHGGDTIGGLVAEGYEIKAAVPNGGRFVVFLQKGDAAYACDFTAVSSSRCEQIK